MIPTRDRPRLLRDAVVSALHALSGIAGELVVVDDGSVVSAELSLANILCSNLFIHTNHHSRGASGSRNTGVEHARGELIAFLDDDDLLRPGYLHWILSVASRQPAIAYGFSAISRLKNTNIVPQLGEFQPTLSKSIADLPLKKRLAGLGCGFWVRRSVFIDLGGLDEQISVNEDTDFCLSLLARSCRGIYSVEPGVLVRTYSVSLDCERTSVTKSTSCSERVRNFKIIMYKHRQYLLINEKLRIHLLQRLLKTLAKSGDHSSAAHLISLWSGTRFLLCCFYYCFQVIVGFLRVRSRAV